MQIPLTKKGSFFLVLLGYCYFYQLALAGFKTILKVKCIKFQVFSRLKSQRPQDIKKIVPVYGDMDKSELGLSSEDQERLINEVSNED